MGQGSPLLINVRISDPLKVGDELVYVDVARVVVVHLLEGLHEHIPRPILLADVVRHVQQLVQVARQVLVPVDGLDELDARELPVAVAVDRLKKLPPALFLGRAVVLTLLPYRL